MTEILQYSVDGCMRSMHEQKAGDEANSPDRKPSKSGAKKRIKT